MIIISLVSFRADLFIIIVIIIIIIFSQKFLLNYGIRHCNPLCLFVRDDNRAILDRLCLYLQMNLCAFSKPDICTNKL